MSNTRFTRLKWIPSKNAVGQSPKLDSNFVPDADYWGTIEPLKISEQVFMGITTMQSTHKITINNLVELSVQDRLVDKRTGYTYWIESINETDSELTCNAYRYGDVRSKL